MIKPAELAICDILKHSTGLFSFQPTINDRNDETNVRVRNIKGELSQIDLNECTWPMKDEYEDFWKRFPDRP